MSRSRRTPRLPGDATSFDDLDPREQAQVREQWSSRLDSLVAELNFAAEFEAAGESYSEADEDGNLIIHEPRA